MKHHTESGWERKATANGAELQGRWSLHWNVRWTDLQWKPTAVVVYKPPAKPTNEGREAGENWGPVTVAYAHDNAQDSLRPDRGCGALSRTSYHQVSPSNSSYSCLVFYTPFSLPSDPCAIAFVRIQAVFPSWRNEKKLLQLSGSRITSRRCLPSRRRNGLISPRKFPKWKILLFRSIWMVARP